MKKIKIISGIILSITFLLSMNSTAQTIKNGQFIIRGAGNDNGNVIVLSDDNYLYIGTTTSYGNGGQDILVVKFAKDFSIIWQKTIGDAGNQSIYDRHHTLENPDGSIVIIGNTSTGGIGGDDILLVKLDKFGTVLWSKAYGGSANERGVSVYKTLDGGYVLGANTNSYPTGKNNLYMLKTDSAGNLMWNKVIGNTNYTGTQVSDILTLSDSSYVFSGLYDGIPSTSNNFVARIDKNGTLQWMKTYASYSGGSGQEGLMFLKQVGNTIVATGGTRTNNQLGGTYDGILINMDFNGDVNWAKVYGGAGNDDLYKIDNTIGSNLRIVCRTTSTFFGGYDMGILEIDAVGSVVRYDVFGSSGDETFKYLSTTPEGGVIFSGQTTGFSAVQGDAYITKAGPTMNGVCNNQNTSIGQASISITPQLLTPSITSNAAMSNLSLSSINASIVIDTLCITVGIDELTKNDDQLNVYPNPFSNVLFIDVEETNTDDYIQIIDVSGKLISDYLVNRLTNKIEVNTEKFHAGIYFIALTNPNTAEIKKMKLVKVME